MFSKKSKKKQQAAIKEILSEQSKNCETRIATGTKVNGTIIGLDNLRISGYLKGEINSKGLVWVEKEGKIEGIINAKMVIIEGEVNGDIESVEKTELRSGGRVIGNICCAKIAVAEDCFFKGEIQMVHEDDRPSGLEKSAD
ncbi:MAG: polymer-forming cytoskeletal protein [Desulfobacterales bacterium]|nr:polymer-forming cytoskeletal protein [Desulfobacterales bacterium]